MAAVVAEAIAVRVEAAAAVAAATATALTAMAALPVLVVVPMLMANDELVWPLPSELTQEALLMCCFAPRRVLSLWHAGSFVEKAHQYHVTMKGSKRGRRPRGRAGSAQQHI